MANRIVIPLDAYPVTLQIVDYKIVEKTINVGRDKTQIRHERVEVTRDVPSDQTKESIQNAIAVANAIWAQADISFHMRHCVLKTTKAPGNAEKVGTEGFVVLVKDLHVKPTFGAGVLFVRKFEDAHLGGRAVENMRACIITYLTNPLLGKTLAHELGHLLSLPDLRNDKVGVVNNYNLMFGSLRAGDKLTPQQITQARDSKLAKGQVP
jgi:hypothetical protein